jgi:hypothetical protein
VAALFFMVYIQRGDPFAIDQADSFKQEDASY